MLFETIFRETGNSTKMQRKRAKENLLTILKFYVEKNHIKGFTEEKDGIVIEY
jgi:hydroxymethylglutaryl-CoA reductase